RPRRSASPSWSHLVAQATGAGAVPVRGGAIGPGWPGPSRLRQTSLASRKFVEGQPPPKRPRLRKPEPAPMLRMQSANACLLPWAAALTVTAAGAAADFALWPEWPEPKIQTSAPTAATATTSEPKTGVATD